jgi:hypothetical protein
MQQILILINNRKLRIYSKFRGFEKSKIIVPEIKLSGRWLESLGFNVGDQIQICCHKNRLFITLLSEKKPD